MSFFFLVKFLMNDQIPHLPVLLNEVLASLAPLSIQNFLDGTLGAGGHAKAVLEAHPELLHYVGIDQDPTALKIAANTLKPWQEKLILNHGNFAEFNRLLTNSKMKFDGILVDLGVSSMQLDEAERGFSFSRNGPLDMRMNPESDLTAEIIVNTWSEQNLGKIFRDYGEEKNWRRAARAIVESRINNPIRTTAQLAAILKPIFPWNPKKKINPLTLIFQALRICVNDELGKIIQFLPKAIEALAPNGRLAVISFHSLEDKIVKGAFQDAARDKESTSGIGGVFLDKIPTVRPVTKKALVANDQEIQFNPRSRSARLRVVEKI
jgi:16S rRNA (cytosine1402-N4)-methyltransferase